MRSRPLSFISSRAFAPGYNWLDAWLGVVLALGGAAIGGITVWRNLYVDIYQIFMPDLLYYACGYGWVHPPQTPGPVIDFLFSRVLSFDCSKLAAPDRALPPGIFVQGQAYLAWCAGLIWRASSPEYRNLWPLAAGLVGSYVGGCFVLFRLFFSRWPAVVGAAILMWSPIGLSMVVSIRDYSKAPFFIWSFVFLMLAVRGRGSRIVVYAALAGALVGIGDGFRADAIIMLPIGLVLLLLTWPGKEWLTRGAAIVAFVAATFVAAPPFLTAGHSGGFGSLVMQGLTEPYRRYLDLGPAPYSFGSRYSDELTLSAIAADLSANDPDWAKKEGLPGENMTNAVLKSGPYVLSWLPFFAGDIATQSLKAAMWTLGMPALVSPARLAEVWGVPNYGRPPAGRKLAFFYDAIGQPWLPWLGLTGIWIFLWQVSARRPQESLALAAVFGAMVGYTFVQFAIRHIFHLEFLWLFAVLAVLRCPAWLVDMKRSAPRFAGVCIAVVCITLGIRFGLVAYQEQSLRRQFEALLAQPRQKVLADVTSLPDGNVLMGVAVPELHRTLVSGPADSMDNTMGQRGTQWQTIAAADRLLLTVGGPNCPNGRLILTAHYAKRPTFWQPLDHDITVDVDSGSQTEVLLPAIYRATQHFDGIAVPAANARCVSRIERINGTTRLPVVLSVVFRPDWQVGPLHRSFGGFPVNNIEPAATFKPH